MTTAWQSEDNWDDSDNNNMMVRFFVEGGDFVCVEIAPAVY